MVDPFAMGAAALFRAPGSVAAIYWPASGNGVPCRVIRGQPEAVSPFGGGGIVQDTNLFQLLRADVPGPQADDQIVIGDEAFTLTGVPTLDVERITWNCTAAPA